MAFARLRLLSGFVDIGTDQVDASLRQRSGFVRVGELPAVHGRTPAVAIAVGAAVATRWVLGSGGLCRQPGLPGGPLSQYFDLDAPRGAILGTMALRRPMYLDIETLLSQAEYYDVEVPRQADIVEKTVRRRSGGGKAGVGGAALNASAGTDIERQSTYSLQPKEKATVSKVIDALIQMDAVKISLDSESVLGKDDLIEIEGLTRITSASLAGKMFFIFRRLMDADANSFESILDLDVNDSQVIEQLKKVYLQNELLPIPILLELTGSGLPQKVYVNVRPGHFIDAASANQVEGELRILGSVYKLIPGGDDGYLSAEEWLLHDWEYLMRRRLMIDVGDLVQDVAGKLEIDLPSQDVHAHISGPAIIVDAIAIY